MCAISSDLTIAPDRPTPSRERARGRIALAIAASLLLHGAGLAAFVSVSATEPGGLPGEEEVAVDVEFVAPPPGDTPELADTASEAAEEAQTSAPAAVTAEAKVEPVRVQAPPEPPPPPDAEAIEPERAEAPPEPPKEEASKEERERKAEAPPEPLPPQEQPAPSLAESTASIAAAPLAPPAEREADTASAPQVGDGGADKAIAAWQSAMIRHLRRFRRAPGAMKERQVRVVLSFRLARNGAVENAAVTESGGNPALDAAALAVLERASPLPAPPAGIPDAGLAMRLPIVFRRFE